MKQIITDLRARGFVIRKRGDLYAVKGVFPALLTPYALRALHASGARRAGGA